VSTPLPPPASSARTISRWWSSPRLLVLLFVLSLPAVTPRIYASDEVQYFAYLRSLWFDHDVSFENEYQHFYDAGVAASPGFHETFLERTTETGRRINFATIGCALLWAPFYAIGDVIARVLHAMGREIAVDGYSQPYVSAVAYASACYGFVALLLSVAIVDDLARAWPSLRLRGVPAASAVWLGTPLLFYMYVAPPMSHATAACAVAAFLLTWLRVREAWEPAGVALLGALAALMTMVREQDAFFVAAPAIDLVWTLLMARESRRLRRLGAVAIGVVVGAVAFLPQALAYLALNGHIGPSRLVARKMTWSAPHAAEVLTSPAHGLFFWTPLALLAIVGLVVLCRHLPSRFHGVSAGFLFAVALQVYVGGSVESWTVAGAFGQRRFVSLTALLVAGIAALLAVARKTRWQRLLVASGLATGIWWNIALIVQFGAGMMDRQRLEPARIAYNTFVVVPRVLPGLTWRYVFDRRSFYESARTLRGQ
jgi:hypothetical protein